jgi:hypothetical protein
VNDDFSLASYRKLMIDLTQLGYETRGYADADPERPHLILRHDIDMWLDAALPIAEMENNLGLKSHYFVLVRTEMYNPFSADAQKALRRLTALGHEVGLHLDASLYLNDPDRLQQAAAEECAVLEVAVNSPVRFISFHRPAKALLGYPDTLAGRMHSYQPRFFMQMGYCSDSQGAWRYGHPLDHPALRDGCALQLLTHPIWWVANGEENVQSKLDCFASLRFDILRAELARNCKSYRPAAATGSPPPASDSV